MANVIDILIPFRLTINQPKSELKQARYHKNKKQKKYITIKFGNMSLKFNYNSIYLIMSKRPKNDPNNMSLERSCEEFQFGGLDLIKYFQIK